MTTMKIISKLFCLNNNAISDSNEAVCKVKELYLEDPSNFFLVEIGANDGFCADRMWRFVNENNPNALMVEPIPDYFFALTENYKNLNNVRFENIALNDIETTLTMTYIPRDVILSGMVRFRLENSPHLWSQHWAQGLGSFYPDRNNLGDPNLKKFQEKIDVQTRTWSYIIDKYEIKNYKNVVIQTDCEGHDLILLKNFPFEKVKPKMYFAEIYGKTRYPESHPRYGEEIGLYSQKDENEAKEIFLKNGYIIHQFGDMLAVLKE